MNNKWIVLLIILVLASAGCRLSGDAVGEGAAPSTSEISTAIPSSTTNPVEVAPGEPQPSALSNQDGLFQAQVISPIDVLLSWEGLSADQFRLEISVNGSEFATLAELPGSASAFETFSAIPGRILQYRLTPYKGSAPEKPLLVEVQIPDQEPNPLQVTLTPDLVTPDPTTIDFSQIDPENVDQAAIMALLAPSQVSETAEIGPEGGEISVTGSNQVRYTYTIPAGALEETIAFTLKPYAGLEGAPLTGGLLGVVEIQPMGLLLNEPAVLTIEPAPGASAAGDEVLAAFSLSPDGSEFYFTHTYTAADAVAFSGSGKMAAPAEQKDDWVMQPWGEPQTKTRPVGLGVTTRSAIRKHAGEHPPSNRQDRTSQNDAAADDDLTPLIPPEYLDFSSRSLSLSGWTDTLTLIGEMESKYLNAKDKKAVLQLMEKALERLADQLEKNFKNNLNNCVAKDDFNAFYAAGSMKSPRLEFMKVLSARYQKKYGTSTVQDVLKKASRCDLKLKVNSDAALKGVDLDIHLMIESTVKLKIHYDANSGSVFYTGTGPIQHINSSGMAGECQTAYLTQGKSSFVVIKLFPVFAPSSATLIDFNLAQYTTPGSKNNMTVKCPEITKVIPTGGGTDPWGGFYTVTKYEDISIQGWQVLSPPTGGDLATVTTSTSRSLDSGAVSEDSTFRIQVKQP